jgi:integrase
VRRTVDFFAGYGGNVESEPKTTKGRRMIALPPFVVLVLRQHQVEQLEERLKAGAAWEDHDLVFTGLRGNYLNPRYVLKLFAQVLRDVDLPHPRFQNSSFFCQIGRAGRSEFMMPMGWKKQ